MVQEYEYLTNSDYVEIGDYANRSNRILANGEVQHVQIMVMDSPPVREQIDMHLLAAARAGSTFKLMCVSRTEERQERVLAEFAPTLSEDGNSYALALKQGSDWFLEKANWDSDELRKRCPANYTLLDPSPLARLTVERASGTAVFLIAGFRDALCLGDTDEEVTVRINANCTVRYYK